MVSPGPAGARPGLELARPRATFISQLIAESQHLPPQRERRRAPPAVAAMAYAHGAEQATSRMPAGFRKNLSV